MGTTELSPLRGSNANHSRALPFLSPPPFPGPSPKLPSYPPISDQTEWPHSHLWFLHNCRQFSASPQPLKGRRRTDSSPHSGWISALFANFQSFQGETLEPAPTDVAGGAGRQLVGDGVVGDALDGVIVPGSKQLR